MLKPPPRVMVPGGGTPGRGFLLRVEPREQHQCLCEGTTERITPPATRTQAAWELEVGLSRHHTCFQCPEQGGPNLSVTSLWHQLEWSETQPS